MKPADEPVGVDPEEDLEDDLVEVVLDLEVDPVGIALDLEDDPVKAVLGPEVDPVEAAPDPEVDLVELEMGDPMGVVLAVAQVEGEPEVEEEPEVGQVEEPVVVVMAMVAMLPEAHHQPALARSGACSGYARPA